MSTIHPFSLPLPSLLLPFPLNTPLKPINKQETNRYDNKQLKLQQQYSQASEQKTPICGWVSGIQIIIKMNIFELVARDPNSYQQLASDYTQHNTNWSLFKRNISALFTNEVPEVDQFITRSKELWAHAIRTSPDLISVMIEHYLNQLELLIESQLDPKLKEITLTFGGSQDSLEKELSASLEVVFDKYCIHEKYIRIFDQEHRYLDIFRRNIHSLLDKYQLKAKTFTLLQMSYFRNSLNILSSEILEFDENVSDHVRERAKGSLQFSLEPLKIKVIFERLFVLGQAEEYLEGFYNFINKQSELYITECTSFSEGKDYLTKCLNFERTFQKHFLKGIKAQLTEELFTRLINQLDDNIYYLYAKHCSKNILDIILDFPDSVKVIEALRKSLQKSPLLNQVGQYLIRQIEKRLLIPGVITQSILNQYINMLKVLQRLDPQGIIFDNITLPIKNYLLKRNDTLRCIISHLTDDIDNYSKLTREVVKIPSKEYIEEQSSQEDENMAKEWQVLSTKEQKMKRRVKYQEIDLVTVLVGLYGSQEAFIGEYQNMMAEKLMSVKDYNISEEMRNIELLKMRFGESALQVCNIILKDVNDSRRNDGVVHNKKAPVNPTSPISLNELNCLSVSKGYWPINYENTSSFNLPASMKLVFEEYANKFAQIKAMRKIHFHYNLGHVNLTLSFENGDFEFKCLPIQAIMITYFDEDKIKDPKNGVSSEELSSELHIPQNIVKQKMSFWVHKGVVKETRVAKQGLSLRKMASTLEDGEVIYYKPLEKYQNVIKDDMDDDFQNSLLKESTSMESHLKHIIEGLIVSILNTNGPKSLQKIHLLLKTVYKTDLDYTYGEAQTTEILKKMLHKKKINFNGEVYSPKDE